MAREFGYYPGCALHGSSSEYGLSVSAVFNELGVELREIKDWNCCGASSAHMLNDKLPVALNARNLALAAEQGITEIVAPCPLCSEGMLGALKKIAESKNTRADIERIIGRKLSGDIKILNIVQAIELTRDLWGPRVKDKKSPLKVACYYGCLLVRPPETVEFDEPEDPKSIEKLVKEFGFDPIKWEFRTECCGGGFTVSNAEDVATLVGRIYEDAIFNGAECIVSVCPMCLANLEMRAGEASRKFSRKFELPIVYLTDLLGMAIGMKPNDYGLDKHLSNTQKLAEVSQSSEPRP